MSYQVVGETISLEAAEDLSSATNHIAQLNSSGLAIEANNSTQPIIGVIIEPAGINKNVTIQTTGVALVKANGAIVAAQPVTATASGRGAALAEGASTAGYQLGYALETDNATGDLVSVLLALGRAET